MKKYIAICFVVMALPLLGKEKIFLPDLCEIESGSNNYATEKRAERGKVETLPKGALDEYNKAHYSRFSSDDSNDPAVNKAVANWYKNEKIPEMLNKRGCADDKINREMAYKYGVAVCTKEIKPEGSVQTVINKWKNTPNEPTGADKYNSVKATSGRVKFPDPPKKQSGFVKQVGGTFKWRN